jgi:predicted nucleic acid-binding protein
VTEGSWGQNFYNELCIALIACPSHALLNELRYGLRKIEARDPVFASLLAAWYDNLIPHPRRFQIISVDRAIAEQAAAFRARHDTPFEDSLIAATAKVHDLTLATRNIADFQACGIKLVNPWEQAPTS